MRNESRNRHLFWVSYADLMTALFIVTLSLFVLSYKLFKDKEDVVIAKEKELSILADQLNAKEQAILSLQSKLDENEMQALSLIEELNSEQARLLVMEEEYRKLREIQKAIEKLDPNYFAYQPEYKRHILRKQVQFPAGQSVIKPQYQADLVNAGRELERLVKEINLEGTNIKYLLVIEGQASLDNYERNFELSYERALALQRLWQEQGITFDPNRVELIIAGSGTGGVGRVEGDEKKNQRFLIQIIPKIGELREIPEAKASEEGEDEEDE
jgi:outer membrane protein OmpA-like peptidoglycan-associated protein